MTVRLRLSRSRSCSTPLPIGSTATGKKSFPTRAAGRALEPFASRKPPSTTTSPPLTVTSPFDILMSLVSTSYAQNQRKGGKEDYEDDDLFGSRGSSSAKVYGT